MNRRFDRGRRNRYGSRNPAITWDEAVRRSEQSVRNVPTLAEAMSSLHAQKANKLEIAPPLDWLAQFILQVHGTPEKEAAPGRHALYARWQVKQAEEIAAEWRELLAVSQFRLSEEEVRRWIRLSGSVTPRHVQQLLDAGISLEDVSLRAWYGRIQDRRERLIDRLCRGDMSIDDVKQELERVRQRGDGHGRGVQ